ESPIRNKEEQVRELEEQLRGAEAVCQKHGIDVHALVAAEGFERTAKMANAREAILVNDDTKKRFLTLVNHLKRLCKAVLPDPSAARFAAVVSTLAALAAMVRAV